MLVLTGVVIFDATGYMFYLANGLIIDAEFDALLFTFFTALWSLNAWAYMVLNLESLSLSKRSLVDLLTTLYLLELPLLAAILDL